MNDYNVLFIVSFARSEEKYMALKNLLLNLFQINILLCLGFQESVSK